MALPPLRDFPPANIALALLGCHAHQSEPHPCIPPHPLIPPLTDLGVVHSKGREGVVDKQALAALPAQQALRLLLLAAPAHRGSAQRLRLAAGEQRRAMHNGD